MSKKKKVKEIPPIMVGEVNIEPMKEDELIALNKTFIKSIYQIRKKHSDSRRELDMLRTFIDNTREKIVEQHGITMIFLSNQEILTPEVGETLKTVKENIKFLEYDIYLSAKKAKEELEKQKLKFLEERDMDIEQELWERINNYKEELDDTFKECRAEIDDNNLRLTKKKKNDKFKKDMAKLLKDRRRKAEELQLKRGNMIKECYSNRSQYCYTEAEKYWHKYKDMIRNYYNNCELTDTNFFTRILMFEGLMLEKCDTYFKKSSETKEEIKNYRNILSLAKKDEMEVNAEMVELKKKSDEVIHKNKNVNYLQTKINKMKDECDYLQKENIKLKESFQNFEQLWIKYIKLLKACENLLSKDVDKVSYKTLKRILKTVTNKVFERLNIIMSDMSNSKKAMIYKSLLYFTKNLPSLQYEIIKNVKSYNDLIDFMEKYFENYDFKNRIPFEQIKGITYRKVPTHENFIVCCADENKSENKK